MNKLGRHKGPDFALLKVVKAEDKILLGKRRVLLPGPDASPDAGEYQQRVDSQGVVSRSFLELTLSLGETEKRSSPEETLFR